MSSAMLVFKQMVEKLSSENELARDASGKWNLWAVGQDWGMSEAEIAELKTQKQGYQLSHNYGEVVVDKVDGAIRAFNFGHGYEKLSLLRQLEVLLAKIDVDRYYTEYRFSLEFEDLGSCSHGCEILNLALDFDDDQEQCIAVDVVMIETEYDDSTEDGFRMLTPTRRVVGQFLYHSLRQVLTHRS